MSERTQVIFFAGTLPVSSFSQSTTRQRSRSELSPPSASETEVRPNRQVFSENEGQTFCYILLLSENPKRINHVMAKLETEQKRWMQVPLCNKRKVCTQNFKNLNLQIYLLGTRNG